MKKWDFDDLREIAEGFQGAFFCLMMLMLLVFLFVFGVAVIIQGCPFGWFACVFIGLCIFADIFAMICEIRDGISHMKWYFHGSEKCPKWLEKHFEDD